MKISKHIWHNTLKICKYSYINPCWRNYLKKRGFVILKNVKSNESNIIKIASQLGQIQDSPYGKIWDTSGKIGIETTDLVYQKCDLMPHTDMNYLENSPKWQLWSANTILSQNIGGETILLDGQAVRNFFKRNLPYNYRYLTQKYYKYVCSEKSNVAYKKVFPKCGSIHYNPYDIIDDSKCYKLDILHKTTLLPCFQIQFKLEQNDVLIVNNHRVLHGRTSFKGKRNLIGCYIS